jgi:hypothetical protein
LLNVEVSLTFTLAETLYSLGKTLSKAPTDDKQKAHVSNDFVRKEVKCQTLRSTPKRQMFVNVYAEMTTVFKPGFVLQTRSDMTGLPLLRGGVFREAVKCP